MSRFVHPYDFREAADREWSAELERLFGDDAGDARYASEGKGEPGSELRRLHDAFVSAMERSE